ncbi:hypothetical protein ACFX2G_034912 [Malus domestica]
MVCPECGDGPVDPTNDSKKKGSTVKDNEKSKRMKEVTDPVHRKIETVITAAGRHVVGFPEGDLLVA